MSQKNQVSATDDVSLPARRKLSTICRSAVTLSDFLASSHFFMKERIVTLEGDVVAKDVGKDSQGELVVGKKVGVEDDENGEGG